MEDPTEHICKLSNDLSSIDGLIISRTKLLKQLQTRRAGYGKAAKSSAQVKDGLIKRIGIAERQNACLEASKAALSAHHTLSLHRAAQSEVPSQCREFMVHAMAKDLSAKFSLSLFFPLREDVCWGICRPAFKSPFKWQTLENAMIGMLQTLSYFMLLICMHFFKKISKEVSLLRLVWHDSGTQPASHPSQATNYHGPCCALGILGP
jgi:hypothetical protein